MFSSIITIRNLIEDTRFISLPLKKHEELVENEITKSRGVVRRGQKGLKPPLK